MDTIEVFRSAYTAIRTNKTRSFLTTLGIIIGVGSVILLVAIGNGLQAYVTQQFQSLGSNLLIILPGKINIRSQSGPPRLTEPKFGFDDVTGLKALGPPIANVSGMVVISGSAKYLNKSWDVTVAGVGTGYAKMRSLTMQKGTFLTDLMVQRSQRVAVIGPKVVEKIFRPGEDPIGKTVEISNQHLEVVGVPDSKGGGIGGAGDLDSFVYIPVSTAEKVFGQKKPAEIIVETEKPEDVLRVTSMIKTYFTRRHLTEDDYTVLEPKEILDQINALLGVMTAALSGIAAISLVVGGIGIANIMLVSVTERTREIGLRKAVGATKRDILVQFLVEAVMLSLLGGGIGIAIGWGLSELLRKFIETAVTVQSVMLAFGISAAVGVVSGIAPAIRAGNLNPIDALRYE
jgi:putative ABC transport system permease protein